MPESTPRIVTCPTCGRAVKWTQGNAYRPFCSERCKLIDFGAWVDEQHTIAGDSIEDDMLSGQLDDSTDR